MYSADRFEFTPESFESTADVVIDATVRDQRGLHAAIARGLCFPDYYGANWNALIDCLSDLSWIDKGEVVIEHLVTPALPKRDLRLYLESLIDAATRRTSEATPRLRLLFRIRDRPAVVAALEAG